MEQLDLTEYMSAAIKRIVANAVKSFFSNPRESAFLTQCAINMKKAALSRNKYEKQGKHIPPFLIASIADTCNLNCAGCYAMASGICGENPDKKRLAPSEWENVFTEARDLGVSFVLLAGGEPLIEKGIIETAAKFPEIVFPVFTNGTLIDDNYLEMFNKSRNLIPVLSIEGDESTTSARRGGGVYQKVLETMGKMHNRGLLFGASVTVTNENRSEVLSAAFIDKLKQEGCRLIFYVEYVPIDESTADLALSEQESVILEKQIQQARDEYEGMIILSFPGDEEKLGGCLAAGRGFFHINPYGGAEPCPFSAFSKSNVRDSSIIDILASDFFKDVRLIEQQVGKNHKGGCALFEKRNEVEKLVSLNNS